MSSRISALRWCALLAFASVLLVGCGPSGETPVSPAAATPSSSTTPTPEATGPPPDSEAIDSELRQNVVESVTSGNTAALYDLWAASVHVTYAASEVEGDVSDRMLLTDNVTNATSVTATWDFDLPDSVVDNYRNNPGSAGSYVDDFPPGVIVGRSSESKVIAFVVSGGLITRLFIADHESSLTFT